MATIPRLNALLIVTALCSPCLASAQTLDPARVGHFSLAALHSDIAFSITSGHRQSSTEDSQTGEKKFDSQVQRVTAALETGVQLLYPEIADRVPGPLNHRFEVYVVEDSEHGSTSSATGRIALNSALGPLSVSDDWLAFVIAREMGHVVARHHEVNSAASLITSVLMNVLLPGSGLLKTALSTGGAKIASNSNQHAQAIDADAIALRLMDASGFDRRALAAAMQRSVSTLDNSSWANKLRASTELVVAEISREKLEDTSWVSKFSVSPAFILGETIRADLPAAETSNSPSARDTEPPMVTALNRGNRVVHFASSSEQLLHDNDHQNGARSVNERSVKYLHLAAYKAGKPADNLASYYDGH
jgi:hypothetical protein